MITFTANRRCAHCNSDDEITTGSVGIPVKFNLSSDWDGLAKIAVFIGSGVTVDVALTEDSCTVPPEVLTRPGDVLTIGLYGTDSSADLVIPTVYAEAGRIHRGAAPSGIDPDPPTPSLIDQLLEAAEGAQALAQGVRDDADAGEFDGEDGASAYQLAVAAGYTGTEAEWLLSLHGADATVDATLSHAGEAADAAETGKVRHTAEYARLFAETLNAGAGIPLDAVWQKGGIADNGNNQNTRTYRARAAGRLHYDAEITLVCDEHHQFFLVRFIASTDEWIGATTWGRSRTVPSTESFRICVRRSPEDTSLEADPEEFAAAVRIQNNIGGGSGGTTDYSDLSNKPQIAGVTLSGNKSLSDLGIAAASDIPAVPVESVNNKTGAVVLTASDVGALPDNTVIPSTPAEIGAAPAVTEVTISTAGAVTQALDAGKIYHFTGALSSLTLTLTAAGAGVIPQYHFDFDSGSTAPTVSVTGVTWQGGSFAPKASTHYEVDILNGYGVVCAW